MSSQKDAELQLYYKIDRIYKDIDILLRSRHTTQNEMAIRILRNRKSQLKFRLSMIRRHGANVLSHQDQEQENIRRVAKLASKAH